MTCRAPSGQNLTFDTRSVAWPVVDVVTRRSPAGGAGCSHDSLSSPETQSLATVTLCTTQKRLSSGSCKTTKSSPGLYRQECRTAPSNISRSTSASRSSAYRSRCSRLLLPSRYSGYLSKDMFGPFPSGSRSTTQPPLGGLAWLIVERLPRELEHSLELVATNDYGPDAHFRSHDLDNGTMLAALGKARFGPTWP